MIPLIEAEVVGKRKWIEKDEFTEMIALAQSAPGSIAINTAVFVGHKLRGWKCSVVSAFGAILPSFFIILLIAVFLSLTIKDSEAVNRIFKGIRPVVVALIAVPACNMLMSIGLKAKPLAIAATAALLICLLNVSPIIIIAVAIAFGLASGMLSQRRKQQ